MKFKRRFFDSTLNFKHISKERLILGIIIGLVAAFTIYSFSYVLRETFRLSSVPFDGRPNIISEANRNFYNIFFAGLSIIFGNSIAINFILSQPQHVFSRHNIKRSRILNDQIFLNFNFGHWFLKMGLVMGAFSMCCMDFPYLPYFYFPFILLLIIMFLDTWKTLIQVLGIKGYKWFLLHFLVVIVLTLLLSRIDIVDYKAMDELSLKSNPIIDLPHSDFYNWENGRRDMIVQFELLKDAHNNLNIITEDKMRISLNDVVHAINAKRASIREELIPLLYVRISAEKDLDLIYVKNFEAELYKAGQWKIIYEVYNDNIYTNRFDFRGITKAITKNVLAFRADKNDTIPPPPGYDLLMEETPINDTLKIAIGHTNSIDGIDIPKHMLDRKFKNYINPKTIFEYQFNLDTKYQDYITVLAAHFKATDQLRKQNQHIFEENEYYHSDEYREEQEKLREEFPIRVIERLYPKNQ